MAISLGRGYFTVGLAGDLKDQVNQAAQHMTQQFAAASRAVGMAFTAMGGAIVGGFGLAIRAAADFDQAITNAASVTGKTGKEFDIARGKMRELALELGEKTAFSAKQCADAFYDLSSKGFDVAAMSINDLIPFLDLAAATQFDLTRTTQLMTSTLRAFGMENSESARIADVFTTACGKSAAKMEYLASSFPIVGAAAHQLGIPFEEVTAALSTLYNNGVDASTAATSLRNMLLDMENPTKKMSDALAQLGIGAGGGGKELIAMGKAAEKAQESLPKLQRDLDTAVQKMQEMQWTGKANASQFMAQENRIVSYQEKIGLANQAITDFTWAQSNAAPATAAFDASAHGLLGSLQFLKDAGMDSSLAMEAFGKENAAAAAILINSIPAAQGLTSALNDCGGAARTVAEIQLSTLKGRVQELMGSVETISIRIGDALIPKLTEWANALIPIVNNVGIWIKENPELTQQIALFTAAVGVAMLALGPLLILLPGIATAFAAILTPVGALVALLSVALVAAFGVSVSSMTGGLGEIAGRAQEYWNQITETFWYGVEIVTQAMTWLWANVIQPVWGYILSAFETGRAWIIEHWDALSQAFWAGAGIIKAALELVWEVIVLVFEMIGVTVSEGFKAVTNDFDMSGKDWLTILNEMLLGFKQGVEWMRDTLKWLRGFFEEHWGAMSMIIGAFASMIVEPLTQTVKLMLWVGDTITWMIKLAGDGLAALAQFAGGLFGFGGAPEGQPRSKGGRVETGNTYRVGEQGPEMFFNDRGNFAKLIGRQGTERAVATQDGWIVNNRMLRAVAHIYRTLYPESNQKTERDRATRRVLDDYGFPHIYPGTVSTWLASQFSKNEMFTKVMAAELGYRKSGGPVSANKPYIVGEAGPELFVPKAAGEILNRSQMGQTVSFNAPLVHVAQMNASNPADVNALAQRLGDELRRRLSARGLQPNFGV